MKTYLIAGIYLCVLGLSASLYFSGLQEPEESGHNRLLPVEIKAVKAGASEEGIRKIVLDANKKGDKISIAGMQHSQGGQTLYPNGILLDMKPYNRILDFDEKAKTITVQSGATWNDIQQHINPYGLSLKVSQSQNIFTVGGSLSVQAHGLDIRNGGMMDSVVSLRLLNASGDIIELSASEKPELFQAVIGGYGLFGVILDVTFELVDDELYEVSTKLFDSKDYTSYFQQQVLGNPKTKMHLARISISPEGFMEEMYAINYSLVDGQEQLPEHSALKEEKLIAAPKLLLGISRLNDEGKGLFWHSQKTYIRSIDGKLISRNNAMRSDSEFMEYSNAAKTEILQEYFVPVDEFADYIEDLKKLLEQEDNFNLLNVTIRYTSQNDKAVLSYAREDMFSLVLLVNQEADAEGIAETGRVVRSMIDVTLDHGGTYYLPYYGYPTQEQMVRSYPRTKEFFDLKDRYDPEQRFLNMFYEEYRQ